VSFSLHSPRLMHVSTTLQRENLVGLRDGRRQCPIEVIHGCIAISTSRTVEVEV